MIRERKNTRKKSTNTNNVDQVSLIEKLQKAALMVRMCRPLVSAAGKRHKSCGGLCLRWADLWLPSGSWLGCLCPPHR